MLGIFGLFILAEPPAESPSTIYISDKDGSFDWQSAFSGRVAPPKLLSVPRLSRPWLPVLLFAARVTLSIIFLASAGCSSKYVSSPLYGLSEMLDFDYLILPLFGIQTAVCRRHLNINNSG